MTPRPAVTAFSDERRLLVLWRRVRWKLHWALRPKELFVIRSWWDGMTLAVPKSGSAAAAYYRTFPSETIAQWISEVLRPGMTAVDVGAHVGVYSLLLARLVGPRGVVHAIEPQRECVSVVERNAALNHLPQLEAHSLALSDADGEIGLDLDPSRLSACAIPAEDAHGLTVPAMTLETFARQEELEAIDLLKLDAAGNELAVLRGARPLLEGGAVGSIICKLYHPDVVADRFGEDLGPRATTEFLRDSGYEVTLPGAGPSDPDPLRELFAMGAYSVPALATRPEPRSDT
jgi:FkbM family methyltransferase